VNLLNVFQPKSDVCHLFAGAGSLKDDLSLPGGSKLVFVKSDLGQIYEQQRHFNEWPIRVLHGEVDSILASLKLFFTSRK
jgi:hypothetical protein